MELTEEQKQEFSNRAKLFLQACANASKQFHLDLKPVLEFTEDGLKPVLKIIEAKDESKEEVTEVKETTSEEVSSVSEVSQESP